MLPLLRQEMTTVERGERWYCGGGSYLLIESVAVVFIFDPVSQCTHFFKDRLTTRRIPVILVDFINESPYPDIIR